ncbi:MAG: DUF853 family protein [Desulfobacterales bacterium]|nr:DUF853 family protein [Desulfobacterales bacterium]
MLQTKAFLLSNWQKQIKKIEATKPKASKGRKRESVGKAFVKNAARSIGSQIGRRIIRGVLGSLFGGK